MDILLNKKISKKNSNTDNFLQVSLGGNQRLLPMDKLVALVSSDEQYNKERERCNKVRLIVTVSPICSNVLFNHISEVVYKEGSEDVKVIGYHRNDEFPRTVKPYYKDKLNNITECVRDTQLTRYDDITMHCGVDVFNNHILRSKTFKSVCQHQNVFNDDKFNTIYETMRTYEGQNVLEYSDTKAGLEATAPDKERVNLYDGSEVLTFDECLDENLFENNGWFGFHNASKMKTYSGKNETDTVMLQISNVINNKRACDFIPLSPEKDLFTFTPKYNGYRGRMEKNWHYCLTYPSSSTTEVSFIDDKTNGLKILQHVTNKNGITLYSISKHGLSVGDRVNIYVDGEKKIENAQISTIINEWNFVINKGSDELTSDDNNISFKQIVQGDEVEYYVRIFSKLPNWRFETNKVSEYTVNETSSQLIENNQQQDFENHISNLGFSQTIYGDAITQIVYTDDINIDYLKDNLGRPLTEIYFTILKNNAGYKEWYKENGNLNDKNIEFSHVFGKLNCGFNLSTRIATDGHITYMNNVSGSTVSGLMNLNGGDTDEIDVLNDVHFYGDLCVFSRNNFAEKTIDDAMFRFNTVQRESGLGLNFVIDEFTSNTEIEETIYGENEYSAGTQKEGYCYKAHYKIPIKTYSVELESQYPDIYTIKKVLSDDEGNYTITTLDNHLFQNGDIFKLYDVNKNEYYDGVIINNINPHIFTCMVNGMDDKITNENKTNFKFIRKYETIPTQAILSKDGTCRYFWRWILQNGYDVNSTNEVYPFTNGALYVNKQINFFLRRQDPTNITNKIYSILDKAPNHYDKTKKDNYLTEEEMQC